MVLGFYVVLVFVLCFFTKKNHNRASDRIGSPASRADANARNIGSDRARLRRVQDRIGSVEQRLRRAQNRIGSAASRAPPESDRIARAALASRIAIGSDRREQCHGM